MPDRRIYEDLGGPSYFLNLMSEAVFRLVNRLIASVNVQDPGSYHPSRQCGRVENERTTCSASVRISGTAYHAGISNQL